MAVFWLSIFYPKFGQLTSRNDLMATFYTIASSSNDSKHVTRSFDCLPIIYQDLLDFFSYFINQHRLRRWIHVYIYIESRRSFNSILQLQLFLHLPWDLLNIFNYELIRLVFHKLDKICSDWEYTSGLQAASPPILTSQQCKNLGYFLILDDPESIAMVKFAYQCL